MGKVTIFCLSSLVSTSALAVCMCESSSLTRAGPDGGKEDDPD